MVGTSQQNHAASSNERERQEQMRIKARERMHQTKPLNRLENPAHMNIHIRKKF